MSSDGQLQVHQVEVGPSREEMVGGIKVRRALPRKGRRTVGAWCFADHMGPIKVTSEQGLDVGPHPHMGLQTVTWLVDGQVLHRDSLGSEQLITKGQLNLMTAGEGVAHAEETSGRYRGELQGIQLWIAQPEATRHGPAGFEHYPELPKGDLDGGVATVLIGEFGDLRSPARHDTDLAGIELALHSSITLELRCDFEYGVIVLEGRVSVGDAIVTPGSFGYLGIGHDEVRVSVPETSRVILLGGKPFEGPILMWWNFVGRTHEEIEAAYSSWKTDDGRFGSVASDLPRIPTKAPYWMCEPKHT